MGSLGSLWPFFWPLRVPKGSDWFLWALRAAELILRSGHVAPPRGDQGTASVLYLGLIAMGGLERERR